MTVGTLSSRFEALFEAIADPVIVIDEHGTIEAFNPAAEKLFGFTRDEILGQPVERLMPEPMASQHHQYVERYLQTREPRIIGIGREVDCRRKDGSLFPASLAVGEGEFEGRRNFVGVLRDLTKTHELQQSLSRSEAELRVILDHSLVATAVVDREGRFLSLNQACIDLSGYTKEEFATLQLSALTPESDRDATQRSFKGALDGDEVTLRHRCMRKDGTIRSGLLHLARMPHSGLEEGRILMQFFDETDRLEAERELSENRDKLAEISRLSVLGEMAAGIAHEINQPLGAISNYAEACRIRLAGKVSPEILELLGKISGQSQRAGEVIRRLRGVARGHASDASEIEVNQLVQDAIKLAGLDARFVGVAVETRLGDDLPLAYADEVAAQQVLLNLLRNAVEATAEAGGTKVCLHTEDAARSGLRRSGILLSIVDEGPGVNPEVAPQIFHPFFTTKKTGMGVGLALCQSLLAENQGELWFENNRDRSGDERTPGASFFVLLPRAESAGDTAEDEPTECERTRT